MYHRSSTFEHTVPCSEVSNLKRTSKKKKKKLHTEVSNNS